MLKVLYEQTGHPIFQNRIYDLAQESKTVSRSISVWWRMG